MLPIQNTKPIQQSGRRTTHPRGESEFLTILRTATKKELSALATLLMPIMADLELRQPRIWGDRSRLHMESATVAINDLLVNTRSGHVTIKQDCFFGHRCMLLTGRTITKRLARNACKRCRTVDGISSWNEASGSAQESQYSAQRTSEKTP